MYIGMQYVNMLLDWGTMDQLRIRGGTEVYYSII